MTEGQYPLSIRKSFTAWMIALRLRLVSSTSDTGNPPVFRHDAQNLLRVVNPECGAMNPPSVLELSPAPQFKLSVWPGCPGDGGSRIHHLLDVRRSPAHRCGLYPDGLVVVDTDDIDDTEQVLPDSSVGIPTLDYLGEIAVAPQPLQRPCCGR